MADLMEINVNNVLMEQDDNDNDDNDDENGAKNRKYGEYWWNTKI